MPCSLHTDMPAYAVSAAILCCFQRRFLSVKPPQIPRLPILSPRMDSADIQGKLLAYFNQLSPEARDRLLASAPAQEVATTRLGFRQRPAKPDIAYQGPAIGGHWQSPGPNA